MRSINTVFSALVAIFTLAACSGEKSNLVFTVESLGNSSSLGGTPPSQPPSTPPATGGATKSLNSIWTDSTGFYSLDLRNAIIGSPSTVPVTSPLVGSCSCNVLLQGLATAGNVSITSCAGVSAQCASFNSDGTYQIIGAILYICSTPTTCQSLL